MSLAFPKPQRLESPAYLKFVRNHSCIIPRCWERVQAHHIVFDGQGRIGSKVSDYQAVPCCDKHHREYHEIGRDRFAVDHALDFQRIIIDLLSEYIETTSIALLLDACRRVVAEDAAGEISIGAIEDCQSAIRKAQGEE